MTRVRVHNFSISLDGYGAGPCQTRRDRVAAPECIARMHRRRSCRLPVTFILVVLGVLATWTGGAGAQPRSGPDTLAVEIAAARHMHAQHPRTPLTLDAALQRPDATPGTASAGLRDSARTVALAGAIGARVVNGPTGEGVYLVLSDPVVHGDTATVTITASWPAGSRGRGYETRQLCLARVDGAWRVVRTRQLGTS